MSARLVAAVLACAVVVQAQPAKPLVYVLSTGGTISGRGDSSTNLANDRSGSLLGERLVSGVPEIEQFADVKVEQIANVAGGVKGLGFAACC